MAPGTSSTRRSTPAASTSPPCWARSWGGGQEAWAFLHRWTGLLALQATVVGPPRKQETFRWAGEVTSLRHLRTGSGIAMPSTGLRANGNALCNPMVEPVLAHALGLEHRTRQPRRWRDWQPPRDKKEWSRSGSPPNPFAYLETVRQAEARSGTPLRDQPFNAFCAKAVQGDMEAWRALANAVEGAGVPLPRGLARFVIERRPGAVVTFWEGRSPTRQKPSVPAAAIIGDRRRVLMPAKWQIPSTQTKSRISETEVRAQADTADVLPRLAEPAGLLELSDRA